MAARRKPHEADTVRVDAITGRIGAHQAHGALGVLQRYVGAVGPAFARQAIAQDETGHARFVEMARHIHAFEIQHLAGIAAARRDNQSRAIGPLRAKDIHHRDTDLIDGAVDRPDIGRLVIEDADRRQGQPFAARRRARPQRDRFLGVAGNRAIARHQRIGQRRQRGSRDPRGGDANGGDSKTHQLATIHAHPPSIVAGKIAFFSFARQGVTP